MVGSYCCVVNCRSSSHDCRGKKINNGFSFYRFPSWRQNEGTMVSEVTKRRRIAWVSAVGRPNITFSQISAAMRVCSRHFQSGKPAYEMLESHQDWAPSLHLGQIEAKKKTETKPSARRLKRKQPRMTDKHTSETIESVTSQTAQCAIGEWPEAAEGEPALKLEKEYDPCELNGASTKHLLIENRALKPGGRAECGFCKCMSAEVKRLSEENRELKHELEKRKMKEEFLKEDDVKVMYYTGLTSFAVLMDVLNHVMPFLPQTDQTLTPFQMLFLTLIRLRLDLPIQHIADLFHIDLKTVSATFVDTIHILHARLCPLIDWPDRPCFMATMPTKFAEAFGDRIAVILDSFEISAEDVSHPKAGEPFSCYKQPCAVKYLIGSTPTGVISFVSKGCRDRGSDKFMAENSGLLDKLLPGDLVLANYAFDGEDSEGIACAEVKIPAEGRRQLDVKNAEETQQIGHLRLHVERVIGSTHNKYTMLHKAVPDSLLHPCEGEEITLLDKIVTVCCALTNMFPSVVVQYDPRHE